MVSTIATEDQGGDEAACTAIHKRAPNGSQPGTKVWTTLEKCIMIKDKVLSTTASLIVNTVEDSSKKKYNVYLHQCVMLIESKNISLMYCSYNEL